VKEHARIISVNNDTITVEIEPHGGCKSCALNNVCKTTGTGKRRVTIPEVRGAYAVGDMVEVETPAHTVMTAAVLVFIVPLVIAGIAYAVIINLTGNNGLGIAGFFLFFALAELILWFFDRIVKKRQYFRPHIVNNTEHYNQ